jgi:DNA-3-methyladenine glycosylase
VLNAVTAGLPLPREFYNRRTLRVARELIGMHLVRVHRGCQLIGRIVETEAYQGPQDLAAHSARGRTDRNAVMFGPPGYAYVYLIYGMWNCVNVITRAAGIPHGILIRAVEPVAHIDQCWGPGLLCKAMRIDRGLNGADLCGDKLWIAAPAALKRCKIARAPRIGVDYAGDWARKHWRFFDRDSPYVSTVTAARRRKVLQIRG